METVTAASWTEPRAWVGCLACYNEARLTGQWLTVDELEDADNLAELICAQDNHEEFWIFDHEGLPISGECSPDEAIRYGRAVLQVIQEAEERACPVPVALQFIEDSNITDPDAWPSIEDAYAGSAKDAADYVIGYLEDQGITLPDWLHVDYVGSFQELTADFTVYRHEGALELFYNN